MLITVLAVPGCASLPVLLDRLDATRPEAAARRELVVISDQAAAAAWGMCGSPTLLVDGVDPFATAGVRPSLSCRLYPGPDGRLSGAPSSEEVRRVTAEPVTSPREETSCLDLVGRAGQGRLAPVAGGLRAVQQAVLRALASAGAVPTADELDRAAAGSGATGGAVLAALAEQDYLTLDESNGLRAAYPFSLVPTRHQVTIEGGPTMWSMCAIDALGVAPMLGRATTIVSADPVTGERISVAMSHGGAAWDPLGALVFAGGRGGAGPASAVCCDAINFFASAHSALRWAALRPEITGRVLDQAGAIQVGRSVFGALLNR